jgi:hypothetical protein
MKKINLIIALALFTFVFSACNNDTKPAENKEANVEKETATTKVTDENYGLAETQTIIQSFVKKIAAATGTDGVGVWMHNKKAANPKDRDVMRKNYDTMYSWIVLDLSTPATLIMKETGGRYQSMWVISEEHYNPFAFNEPGEYELTAENVGTPYAIVVVRTQANMSDSADVAEANKIQETLDIKQAKRGTYVASHKWDMDELKAMRTKYQTIAKEEKISPDKYFGKKGTPSLKEHNCGTAVGWGGFTKDQAAYVDYYPTTDAPQTLTLKDVPAKAFWSITVYDKEGFAVTETYNINSQFAKKEDDGSVIIHFGGDASQDNYMETFKDWTFILRLYLPKENYLDGSWVRPELALVE